MQIPIRRISLYDINKNREEVKAITARLKEIARRLKDLKGCAIEYLEGMLTKFPAEELKRHTQIASFSAVDVKAVSKRDIALRYDEKSGYLGTSVSTGTEILRVTDYDRIFFMRKSGMYMVCDVPEKLFVDSGMWYCGYSDKESLSKVLFTIIYRDPKTKYCYIKKCRIEGYIMNRDYFIVPEGMEVLHVDTKAKFAVKLNYVRTSRTKIFDETFKTSDYEEKGLKAQGVRLSSKEVESIEIIAPKKSVQAELDLAEPPTKPAPKPAATKSASAKTVSSKPVSSKSAAPAKEPSSKPVLTTPKPATATKTTIAKPAPTTPKTATAKPAPTTTNTETAKPAPTAKPTTPPTPKKGTMPDMGSALESVKINKKK